MPTVEQLFRFVAVFVEEDSFPDTGLMAWAENQCRLIEHLCTKFYEGIW